MIRKKINPNVSIALLAILFSSCAVQNLSATQQICNFSVNPRAVSSGVNDGQAHRSQKVHSLFGLISWGDASLQSAEDAAHNGTMKLSKIATVDEQRKFLLGIGYYQIIVYGTFQ